MSAATKAAPKAARKTKAAAIVVDTITVPGLGSIDIVESPAPVAIVSHAIPLQAKDKRATRARRSAQLETAKSLAKLDETRAQLLDAFIAEQPSGRQRAMRRWMHKLAESGETFGTLSAQTLAHIIKDCGKIAAAKLLGADVAALSSRSADTRGAAGQRPPRTQRASRFTEELERSRARLLGTPSAAPVVALDAAPVVDTIALVDDSARAIVLSACSEGDVVKTPDSPLEGIAGTRATIVRVGTHSVSVRPVGGRRITIRTRAGDEAEFDAPGRVVQWAPSTRVVVQSAARA